MYKDPEERENAMKEVKEEVEGIKQEKLNEARENLNVKK